MLGDIKLENFGMRDSDFKAGDFSKIIFLDCDSYQLDKFPCQVYTDSYQAPETSGASIGQFYRAIEYDRYSIYVAIFRLLFRRMLPHSRIRKPEEPDQDKWEAARSGVFPYSLTDARKTEASAPKAGGCAAIWSHLPKYVKQALFDAGDKKSGKNYMPLTRKSAGEWEKIFKCYLADIKNKKLSKDKDYNVGYPMTACNYADVDIEMVREVQDSVVRVSLKAAVKTALITAGFKPDPSLDSLVATIVNELSYKAVYKSDKIQIKLVKYLGVACKIDFVYKG